MIDQHLLAAAVRLVHRLQLRQRHVRFIDDGQEVRREEVEEAVGARPRAAVRQMHRIVLDPAAITDLPHHLDVVGDPLVEPLCLDQQIVLLEPGDPVAHFGENVVRGVLDPLRRQHEVAAGEERHRLRTGLHLAGGDVAPLDRLDLVAEKGHADEVVPLRFEDIHHIAPHPELPLLRRGVVAAVLDVDQTAENLVPPVGVADRDMDAEVGIVVGRTQAVDAGDARDHDHVAPLHQARRRREAELFDVLVDRSVLGDVGIGLRNVGLRQVVVVVADEVLHRVLREKPLELAVKLRRQRLVVRQHQHRPVQFGDRVRQREGLAGTGHPQQRLVTAPFAEVRQQFRNRLRLVAGGRVGSVQLEESHSARLLTVPASAAAIRGRRGRAAGRTPPARPCPERTQRADTVRPSSPAPA